MLFRTAIKYRLVLLCFSSILGACSSVDTLIDESAPTMEQVYEEHTRTTNNDPVNRHRENLRREAETANNPYSFDPHFLSAKTHSDNLFQKLPNPIIYMYVKPHPAGVSGSPVPGYITKFYLYERDHFAQPGELIDRDLDAEAR